MTSNKNKTRKQLKIFELSGELIAWHKHQYFSEGLRKI